MFQKFSFIIIFFVNINAFAYDLTGENYSHFSGFNLNESSLNDVQKEWGPAKIIIDGDASTASHRINYYFEKDNYYITFNSDEMGGGKIITSFLMCAGIPQEAFVSKSELILSQNDFAGLRIGMSINEIMLSFPKNTLLKKDKMLIALTKKG